MCLNYSNMLTSGIGEAIEKNKGEMEKKVEHSFEVEGYKRL